MDYNLEITRFEDFEDCHRLKEYVRKTFNKCLQEYGLRDCEDSHSSLTTKHICFKEGNPTKFSIDLCITVRDEKDNYYRLIHEKTGLTYKDRYFWNMAPQSKQLKKKVIYIKEHSGWIFVRKQYLKIKNLYLSKNDKDHPSFVCYLEAINNVYNSRNHW